MKDKWDKRFWFGVAVSVAWLGWMGWQLYCAGLPKELNAQGDFFAGFFAPLAFLWLVLGYLQQGEELRMQAQELKNSVEQQTQLVQVSRDQLGQQAHALDEERKRFRAMSLPQFFINADVAALTHDGHTLKVTVFNHGGPATSFAAAAKAFDASHPELRLPHFKSEVGHGFAVKIAPDFKSQGTMSYVDVFGDKHDLVFSLRVLGDGHVSVEQPTPPAPSKMVFADK